MRLLKQAGTTLNRHLEQCVAIATLSVLARNWLLWQTDKASVQRLRAQRRQLPSLPRTPKVSVLVAAWNEQAHIEAHIASFLALTYPDCELVLCAGGSDHTFDLAKQHAGSRIVVLEQVPNEGKQHALARCFERAVGEVMYLTDADCRLNDEALLRLLEPIVNEEEVVTTGWSRPLDRQISRVLPYYLWARDLASNASSPAYAQGLLGRNAAVTRAAISTIGGLDFLAATGTDYHLARRLIDRGAGIRHVASSVVATEYPGTLAAYRRQQSRWLRNLLIFGRVYKSKRDVMLTLRTSHTGLVMLLLPSLSAVFGRLPTYAWLVLYSQAVCAKIRYVGMAARLGYGKPPRRLWVCLPALTLIDFAVWAAPTLDLLSRGRRVRW